MKKILFLSAIDFKDKSIQVIRKTPEGYRDAGWKVDYLVYRDRSFRSNYYYEQEINPEGISVIRRYVPLERLKNTIKFQVINAIISKLAGCMVVFGLYRQAIALCRQKKYDVIYGYETRGVLATLLVRLALTVTRQDLPFIIHRFQGTWLTSYLKNKNYLKLFLNADAVFALRLIPDLTIMTNDGTEGAWAAQAIRRWKKSTKVEFLINGAENQTKDNALEKEFVSKYGLEGNRVLISVSRLVCWKRVDRCIAVAKELERIGFTNFKYLVVGEGVERARLEELVEEQGLNDRIVFVGAVPNNQVGSLLSIADLFMSFYDLSNVGNPLFEAIRANKIIVTLSNGSTHEWIDHWRTGLIYAPDDGFSRQAALDITTLLRDDVKIASIKLSIAALEEDKLWNWHQRMKHEVMVVDEMLVQRSKSPD